jgi:hypothetical protein
MRGRHEDTSISRYSFEFEAAALLEPYLPYLPLTPTQTLTLTLTVTLTLTLTLNLVS